MTIRFLTITAAVLLIAAPLPGAATPGADQTPAGPHRPTGVTTAQSRSSCKAVSTCREAVIMWCGGYRRADADDDGIPCENVCRSRAQVEAIEREIGC